jgi:hypothetical protein
VFTADATTQLDPTENFRQDQIRRIRKQRKTKALKIQAKIREATASFLYSSCRGKKNQLLQNFTSEILGSELQQTGAAVGAHDAHGWPRVARNTVSPCLSSAAPSLPGRRAGPDTTKEEFLRRNGADFAAGRGGGEELRRGVGGGWSWIRWARERRGRKQGKEEAEELVGSCSLLSLCAPNDRPRWFLAAFLHPLRPTLLIFLWDGFGHVQLSPFALFSHNRETREMGNGTRQLLNYARTAADLLTSWSYCYILSLPS